MSLKLVELLLIVATALPDGQAARIEQRIPYKEKFATLSECRDMRKKLGDKIRAEHSKMQRAAAKKRSKAKKEPSRVLVLVCRGPRTWHI